jgi:Single-strand binding protein family
MTTFALVTGVLFRDPKQLTSKSGRVFVSATVRAKDGDAVQWWRISGFNDTVRAALMDARDGESISAQGVLKVETYLAENGDARLSLGLIAYDVMPLRRAKKSKPAAPRQSNDRRAPPLAPEYDDQIPF